MGWLDRMAELKATLGGRVDSGVGGRVWSWELELGGGPEFEAGLEVEASG